MSKLLRLPALLLSAVLALALDAAAAAAQKALVYCPTDEVETCGNVVAALASTGAYPEGVDKAYDGANGTVDLRTADLFAYTVFVVPSLSDDEEGTPLALLRDPAVAARLKLALLGRRAFYSGTPDLGTTNRLAKNTLIVNLVRWSGANYDAVRGPGLVVLQDNSEVEATRYDWVRGLTGLTVTADVALRTYASVRTMTATGMTIMSSGGTQLAYDNMASFGFYFPNGAPGLSLDAVGQTGTSVGGQVVLVTAEGANTGGATVTTDRDDYAPGTTVTMTGAGFAAGESVTLTLHEDPLVHQDRTFTATTDAQGGFVFTGFAPEEHDIGVRFILTAKGQTSGRQAQTTFTDAQPSSIALTPASVTVTQGGTATYTANVVVGGNGNVCTITLDVVWTAGSAPPGVSASYNNNPITTNGTFSRTLTITTTTGGPPAGRTPSGTYGFTARANRSANCQGSGAETTAGTLIVSAASAATTTTAAPATATFSAAAQSVALSATVTSTSTVNVGTVTFTVRDASNATVGSPVTSGTVTSGAASASYSLPAGTPAGPYTITAQYTPGTGFDASSGTAALTVGQASQTITFTQPGSPAAFGTTFAVAPTASSGLAVTVLASGACSISSGTVTMTSGTGDCTLTAQQAGNTNYSAATDVVRTVAAAKATATLALDAATLAQAYDGTPRVVTATTTPAALAGVAITYAGSGTAPTAAGTYAIVAALTNPNYQATNATGSLVVSPAALTVVAANQTRAYNQPNPTLTGTLTGVLAGDGITASYTTTAIQTSAVGAYPITATLNDPNGKLANYAVTNTPGTLTITKADQTITFAQPANPVYGAAPLAVTGTATSGLAVEFSTTGTACSVASGGGSNLLSATSAGSCTITAAQPGDANYNAAPSVAYTLSVAPKSVSVGTVTVASKTYDGTTAATISASLLAAGSAVGGDAVGLTGGTATFADRNVGTGKTVNVTGLTLTGAQAGNYVLASGTATTTANITALAVTPAVTVANKQYDGLTSATIATATATGVLAGDDATLTGGTASFADKSVGTAKPVTITGLTLGGAQGGNYALTSTTANATADITPKALAVGTVTVADKVYDGNTTATITGRTLAAGGVVGSDAVSLENGTATFGSKTVGAAKPVSVTGLTLGGTDAGNYTLTASTANATASITAKSVTASISVSNKVYDGTTAATATGSVSGTIGGDAVTVAVSGAVFDTKDVGTGKTVTATVGLTGTDAGNYALASTTAATTANITAKALAIAGVAAANKIYDGTTTAALSGATLGAGVEVGDVVSLTGGTATFDTKNVGTGKTVTATGFSLTGAQSGNYSLTATSATTTADITARTITGSTIAATDKVYDGTTTASVTGTLGAGKVAGDALALAVSNAQFDSKDVGTNKPVTATLSLTGGDMGNYVLSSTTAATTASITAKALVGSFTANNKVYDATTTATVATTSLPGVIGPDPVTLNVTGAAFATKQVGNGKTVTANLALTGAASGNYTVNPTATATADITPATVTGSFTASNKVYDGNATATIATRAIASGILLTDNVTLTNGTATFADKNVGNGKTVTGTGFQLGGADGGNYVLGTVATTTANITPASVAPSFTAQSRVYDATTAATIASRSLGGVIGSDAVNLTGGTATFDTKNVGTGKTVTATSFTLAGGDAGNYVLNPSTATTTANITAAPATATVTAANKVYDGNTTATASAGAGGGLTGILGSDAANLVVGTASFASKAAGTGKTVTVNVSLSGSDASNYALTSPVTTTADITPKSVTGVVAASDKVYDGTTTATLTTKSVTGLVGSDAVSLVAAAANFDTKDIGTNKTVTASGLSLGGADAGNYALSATTAATTASVTPATVTGAFTAASKVYDGNTTATIGVRSITGGVVASETVTLEGGTATFANKNVGTGKTVTGIGFTLGGAGASNYVLGTVATTTADITAKAITGSFTAANKVYDGSAAATVLTQTLNGTVGTDAVSLTGGTATFADENVGTGKTVTLAGAALSGADATNYSLASVGTTTANITARAITGNFTASNKTYDGTAAATVLTRTLNGTVAGDAIALDGGTATFADRHVGNAKTVTLAGAGLAGADAGNYSLTSVGTTTANITPLGITGSFTAANKVYDGTTSATVVTSTPNGILASDAVTLGGGTATFDTKHVGTGKTVTLAGATLGGAQAGNYSLTSVGTTTANITVRTLVVTATGINKVFDNNTNATVTLSGNAVGGDVLTLGYTNASFADPNVGTGKTVTVTGISITGGTDAANYVPNTTTTTTVANITTKGIVVVANSYTRQYSDPNPTLTGSVSGIVAGDNSVGVAYTTTATPSSPVSGSPYPIVPSLTGAGAGNYTLSATNGTLTVTPENANVVYSGLMNVATVSPSNGEATINLVASVTDTTALNAAADPNAGNVTSATVDFLKEDGSAIPNCTGRPVVLINAGDTKVGTATCLYTVNIGNAEGLSYGVDIVVKGNYTGSDETIINVYKPLDAFITGGGFLTMSAPGGQYAADRASKTNFGFNVKYNKSGTNQQGNVNIIFRRTVAGVVRTYQIKSNAISSLVSDLRNAPYTGSFVGKANLSDVTNPNAPVTISGNLDLQLSMIDNGTSTPDVLGIQLMSGNYLWYSSNWTGGRTAEQALGGGNLVVR